MAKTYQKRDARIRQIAQATLELIAESGLRKFTTKAVAEKVGITDGTIFRHFKNKEDIVLAAMDLLEARMFADGFPEDIDPLARLEAFFRNRAAMLGGQASLGRLMFSEQLVHAAGDAGRQKLSSWRKQNTDFVLSCLDQLHREKRLPKKLKPANLRVIFQGTLLTFAFERSLQDNDDEQLAQHIDESWDTLSYVLTKSTQ